VIGLAETLGIGIDTRLGRDIAALQVS